MNIQTLKGFRDFLPIEARKRQFVISTLKKVFEKYGFEPLETPALEYEEILLGKYGEEGDKLMYRFEDNGQRRVALRYDQTVPLARVVAQYGNTLPIPFKRYQVQPVWRAENTQKGRFREFLQCDIDTVGLNSSEADAEIVQICVEALKSLGFEKFKVLINDRAIFSDVSIEVIRIIDKLDKIGEEKVLEELKATGLSEDEAKTIFNKIANSKLTPTLGGIFESLNNLGVDENLYEFSPTLARGLDYYTGMIIEIKIDEYSAGSVLGGGRYDNLVGMFSSQKVPAVGCAFGFDRILDAMEQFDLFPKDLTTTQVLVTIFSEDLNKNSIEVANKLRENGINCELWLDKNAKLEKQLKYADQKGIPYVVIIGPNEAQVGKLMLKDLQLKQQAEVNLDELISKLTA